MGTSASLTPGHPVLDPGTTNSRLPSRDGKQAGSALPAALSRWQLLHGKPRPAAPAPGADEAVSTPPMPAAP
jgi:hypothetical protein